MASSHQEREDFADRHGIEAYRLSAGDDRRQNALARSREQDKDRRALRFLEGLEQSVRRLDVQRVRAQNKNSSLSLERPARRLANHLPDLSDGRELAFGFDLVEVRMKPSQGPILGALIVTRDERRPKPEGYGALSDPRRTIKQVSVGHLPGRERALEQP